MKRSLRRASCKPIAMTIFAYVSRFLIQPGLAPLVLLLGALSSVFLFGHDRGHFYRDGDHGVPGIELQLHHDWMSSQGLAQAVNLSLADGLLLFVDRTHDADGDLTYSTYARWPIGSYVLVKLAILPFEGDLSATIHASRIANLLLFAAAAVVAYLAFARLAGRWVALTATLIPFSSSFALYYNDAFVPDAVPALLGLLLTFHGMVVYVQEGRFGQLMVKSCLALLLCWHAYALLLPFVVLGLMQDMLREIRSDRNPSSWAAISGRLLAVLRASRHLRLGFATLGFGMALLSFNLVNEYMALNGKVPVGDLPTIQSLSYRLGTDIDLADFIGQQLNRIAVMAVPYASHGWLPSSDIRSGTLESVGLLLLASGCIGLAFLRQRTVLASLLFAGFAWAFALHNFVSIHDFQALFHIGIPLVAISFAGTLLHRYLVYGCSVLATVLFVLSSVKMAGVGHDPVQAQREHEMLREFQAIRSIVGDDTVFIDGNQVNRLGGAPLASSYFMTGRVVEYPSLFFGRSVDPSIGGRGDLADYVISDKDIRPRSLTPQNKHIFLYTAYTAENLRELNLEGEILQDFRVIRSIVGNGTVFINTEQIGPLCATPALASLASSYFMTGNVENADYVISGRCLYPPHLLSLTPQNKHVFLYDRTFDRLIDAEFDVYLDRRVRSLLYVKSPCAPEDADTRFYLHVVAQDEEEFPAERSRRLIDESFYFKFKNWGGRADGDCVAQVKLPSYVIGRIWTGPVAPGVIRVKQFSLNE